MPSKRYSRGLLLSVCLTTVAGVGPQVFSYAGQLRIQVPVSQDQDQSSPSPRGQGAPITSTEASTEIPLSDAEQLHLKFRRKVSAEYIQTSGGDDACQCDHEDIRYSLRPDDGWHLLVGRSTLVKAASKGDYSTSLLSEQQDVATWSVSTTRHGVGTSGRVLFRLQIVEYQ
jgi:hypothetical protein